VVCQPVLNSETNAIPRCSENVPRQQITVLVYRNLHLFLFGNINTGYAPVFSLGRPAPILRARSVRLHTNQDVARVAASEHCARAVHALSRCDLHAVVLVQSNTSLTGGYG